MANGSTRRGFWNLLAGLPLLGRMTAAHGQPGPAPSGPPGYEMITIFLRHDETKTVDEINQHLKQTGWFRDFPPAGVEIVSWYVMMGVGQVVTLRFRSEQLRDINRLVEGEAWGGYRTEFYPTYDYRQLWQDLKARMQ